jgi:predicted MFS family arabinose efflux permease
MCSSDRFGTVPLYKNVRTFYILAMLRDRTLLSLTAANVVSAIGTAMTFIALPWFVLETTGSATRMSVVLAVEIAPMAIFGIPSGGVVGRLGGRTAMLAGDLLRAPLIALVPVLHWTGALTFGLLLAIVFGVGLFTAPYIAAQRSIVPELFGGDETLVSKASALLGGASQLAIVLGPALAGVLISALGPAPVLLVDGATYLLAFVIVLLLVDGGERVPPDADSAGVLAGVRYLARDRVLGPITLTVIVLDASAGALTVAIPLLAYTRFDQDAHIAGWVFAGFGVGAVLGSLATMKLLDRFRPLQLASVGVVLASLPIWVLVAHVPALVVGVAMFCCGLFIPMINAPALGIITTRPPPSVRPKVMTAVLTASALGGPLGRVAVGPVYDARGIATSFAVIAGGMTLGAVLFALAATLGDRREATPPVSPLTAG